MQTGPIGTFVRTDAGDGSCADCLSVVARPVPTSTTPGVLGAGASHEVLTCAGPGSWTVRGDGPAGAVVHVTSFVSRERAAGDVLGAGTRARVRRR